jgi:diguanylate cyclase (GGDEF)-like protein/hemerythrin-like metal-binding protein/PAS domain S-box-containing protein
MEINKTIAIFPWNENLKTHIDIIDQQHKRLVDLLNQLASHVVFTSDQSELISIFDQLSDYTVYHFHTEEEIWNRYLPNDPLVIAHANGHQHFIDDLHKLKTQTNAKADDDIIGNILAFLTRWLITHILESDRYLAMVVRAMQSGISLDRAKVQATSDMAGATLELIDVILASYESLSANTMYLMREIAKQKKLTALLSQQESHHKALMSVLPVGVFETDKECICTYVNQRWTEITGFSENAAIGSNWKHGIHPEDAPDVEHEWFTALAEKRSFTLEFRLVHVDGTITWVLCLLAPLNVSDQRKTGFIGTLTNISQLKKTELTLGHTTTKLIRAQNIARLGNWSYRVADGKIEWSDQLYTIFGRNKNDQVLTYKTLLSWIHPDHQDAHNAYLQRMQSLSPATSANMEHLQYRILLPNDEERWVDVTFEAEFNADAQPTLFFGTVQDITECKQAELAISARDRQLKFITDHSPVYIAYCDTNEHYKFANQGYASLFGLQPAELVGQSISDILDKDAYSQARPHIEEALSGKTIEYELSVTQPKGKTYLLVRYCPELDKDHRVVGFIAAASDITTLKNTQQFEQFRSAILELLAQDTPIRVVLEKIVTGIEALNQDMLCSILLANPAETHLGEGISPSLPDFYNQELASIAIDMGEGSCGTAAYIGRRVIVEDVLDHPYWVPYRSLTRRAGLRACWSQPFFSSLDRILGTFAIYHRTIHIPTQQEINQIEQTAHLVSVAIENSRSNDRLRDSENRMRVLFEQAPLAYQSLDSEANILEINALWLEQMGYQRDEVIGRFIGDYIADDSQTMLQGEFPKFKASGKVDGPVFEMIRKNGSRFLWQVNGRISRDAEGRFLRTHCLMTDITERHQVQAKLQLAASVFSHAREGIVITDAEGSIVEVNDTFSRLTGYSHDEVIGQNPRILQSGRQSSAFYAAMWQSIATEGYWKGEIWNSRKNGEIYAELLTISTVHNSDGHVQNYVGLFTDISQMKAHQQQLEQIANYDILTNLPNRVLLADRLDQAIAQCQRHQQSLAVVFLDLDGFKDINDLHGHDVGDELLTIVSRHMSKALREGDTLARLGGDEFVAVIVDLDKIEDCEPVLQRLLEAASSPIIIRETALQVSASIGVTFYPQDLSDADLLIRHADQAMYTAKQFGKNCYQLFDTVNDHDVKTHRDHVIQIHSALVQQQFVLHYQPKVNLRTGTVIGVEALIRWQHPQQGLLLPGDFLPWIDDNPLDITLGEWVIDTALTQIADWQNVGMDLPISINIGAHQLQQDNFTSRLSELLAEHSEVKPHYLELEILETSALTDITRISSMMHSCCALGVHFSLDDFGTGYSSLTHLRHLPATLIKIDQSFVRDMLEDPDDLSIVKGVISLASAFRREVIAEGVETMGHGDRLLEMGCELVQGYGIAKPMAAGLIPDWVNSWQLNNAKKD